MSAAIVDFAGLGPSAKAALVVGTAPAIAGLTAGLNWVAAIPWRRNRHEHWAEQARRRHPVAAAAQSLPWLIPLSLVLGTRLLDPGAPVSLFVGLGLAGCAGATAGNIPGAREAFPRVGWREQVRQVVIGFFLRFVLVFALVATMAVMPQTFDWRAAVLGGLLIGLHLYWSHSGWRQIGRSIGLLAPAPARLRRVVDSVAVRSGTTCRGVWVLRVSTCQAFAMPLSRELLFSERMLSIMPDEEIAAICAHELAHLTESGATTLLRVVRSLYLMPWIYLVPLVHALGPVGVYVPLVLMVAIPAATAAFCRRLESRADALATGATDSGGVYARALLRLCEDNLSPVVNPGRRSTHPHLYDRVLAAGTIPDFPRPKPPAAMAWHGTFFSMLLGAEIAIFVIGRMH